jgi:hypothetical protein
MAPLGEGALARPMKSGRARASVSAAVSQVWDHQGWFTKGGSMGGSPAWGGSKGGSPPPPARGAPRRAEAKVEMHALLFEKKGGAARKTKGGARRAEAKVESGSPRRRRNRSLLGWFSGWFSPVGWFKGWFSPVGCFSGCYSPGVLLRPSDN